MKTSLPFAVAAELQTFKLTQVISNLDHCHGVLTFRNEVMSPPHQKINCFFFWRPHRARIHWNLKDLSGEGFPL